MQLSALCPAGLSGVLELVSGSLEALVFDSASQGAGLTPHFADVAEDLGQVAFRHTPTWGDTGSRRAYACTAAGRE